MDITEALKTLPAQIAHVAGQETKALAERNRLDLSVKRLRAKKFLDFRAKKDGTAVKAIDYTLDVDNEICQLQDLSLYADIDYRAFKIQKEHLEKEFDSAIEQGRNARQEWYATHDTVRK